MCEIRLRYSKEVKGLRGALKLLTSLVKIIHKLSQILYAHLTHDWLKDYKIVWFIILQQTTRQK